MKQKLFRFSKQPRISNTTQITLGFYCDKKGKHTVESICNVNSSNVPLIKSYLEYHISRIPVTAINPSRSEKATIYYRPYINSKMQKSEDKTNIVAIHPSKIKAIVLDLIDEIPYKPVWVSLNCKSSGTVYSIGTNKVILDGENVSIVGEDGLSKKLKLPNHTITIQDFPLYKVKKLCSHHPMDRSSNDFGEIICDHCNETIKS